MNDGDVAHQLIHTDADADIEAQTQARVKRILCFVIMPSLGNLSNICCLQMCDGWCNKDLYITE